MKISVPILLCLALAGCLKTPGKGPWSTATGAEQHERLMWQAIHAQKWNEVEQHLAPSFVGVSASGQKFDRAGWVDYWKARQPVDASLGEVIVQPGGADMVVSYELHLQGLHFSGGASSSAGIQVLSVWQQLKHGWVMISQSMTPVKSN